MDPQEVNVSIHEDIAETQKLLAVVTRPVVRDRLLQLLHSLQQVDNAQRLSTSASTYSATQRSLLSKAVLSRRLLGRCLFRQVFRLSQAAHSTVSFYQITSHVTSTH